jgi:hypothetical protein
MMRNIGRLRGFAAARLRGFQATTGSVAAAPAAPTSLTATAASATQINLAWTDPAGSVTGHKVYRGTSAGTETLLATIGAVLTYNDTGLTAGTQYFYKVTATNATGEGPQSNEANATTLPAPVIYALDTFTDTNGTNLTAHTMDVGTGWIVSAQAGVAYPTATIQGNKAASGASSNYGAFLEDAGVFNGLLTCDIVSDTAGDGGLHFRGTDANNTWMARWNQGGAQAVEIYERTAGTWTQKATAALAGAIQTAYTITITLNGTAISATVNGVTASCVSSIRQTATKHGLYVTGTAGATWDNYKVASLALVATLASATSFLLTSALSWGGAPVNYQFQRAPDSAGSPGTYANVGPNSTATSYTDTGLTTLNIYWYRLVATDAGSNVNTTAGVRVQARAAGTYYLATAGSDANNGLTTGTAWQTIGKLNGLVSFLAGDTFLFNKGDTFSGNLHLQNAAPTASQPLTIGSYGTGAAPVISCGNSYGIWIDTVPNVVIQNLTITGSGVTATPGTPWVTSTTSTAPGIQFSSVNSGNIAGFTITGCTVSGCLKGIANIATAVYPATNGYSNIVITNNTVHDCLLHGLHVFSVDAANPNVVAFLNPQINGNIVYNIYGDSTGTIKHNSGYGMLVESFSGGLISGNLVHDCGQANFIGSGAGPVGIILALGTGLSILSNEVYNQFDADGNDGSAIDVESGARNCTVSFNWLHDCANAAYETGNQSNCSTVTGNVFSWNVCQNNGKKNNHGSLFYSFNAVNMGTTTVVNNTNYHDFTATVATNIIKSLAGNTTFANNILILRHGSGCQYGTFLSTDKLIGNIYDTDFTAQVVYNGVTYTSLALMHAATIQGLEYLGTTNYGQQGAVSLSSIGTGTAQLPTNPVTHLTAYDPTGGISEGTGIDLLGVLGITPSATDYHGNPTVKAGLWDVGAVKS